MQFNPMRHHTPDEDLDTLFQLAWDAVKSICGHPSRKLDLAYGGTESAEALEIGTWMGESALRLADVVDRVYCVDHWQGCPDPVDRLNYIVGEVGQKVLFETFCQNMGDELYRSIIPCFGSSETYAKIWPRKVSLVFIDGDHTYRAVKQDIELWLPHVLPGGVLCGHDFGFFPGVTAAVQDSGLEFEHKGCMWWHHVR